MFEQEYTPITELKEGDEFHGYQQYFQVLNVTDTGRSNCKSGKRVTVFIFAGDAHRVECGDYDDILDMLNAALDFTSNHDEYWEKEHPEITLCAAWPDDPDFDKVKELYEKLPNGEYAIKDKFTGEYYTWLP